MTKKQTNQTRQDLQTNLQKNMPKTKTSVFTLW